MASRSSVMNRVQMFEVSSVKKEPVSAARSRRLSQAPRNQRRDDVNSRTSPYRAPKPTVAESVDWPREDEGGIPAPSSERGYGGHLVSSRDAPPAPRYHHAPGSPRSSRSQRPSSPKAHSNNPPSPRGSRSRKPHSLRSSQLHHPLSPRSSSYHNPSSPRLSNSQRSHSPRSFNSQQPQSPTRSSKSKPRPSSGASASEKGGAPPYQGHNHTQASPMMSGKPSMKGEPRPPSVSSSSSSQTSMVYNERREEHRRVPSKDENSNPAESKGVVVGWPSEEDDVNPAEQHQRQPAPNSVGKARPSGVLGRLSKIKTSTRRRSPSPLMMEQAQPPSGGTRGESPSSERSQREEETRSHLNLALKRSLDDASTVLQEERASSVATSSSSLSSDELTSIAKRALQTAHKRSVAKDAERDDVSVVSTSSRTSLSSSRSRLSKYSAARKRTAIARKGADIEDAILGASIQTVRSGSPSIRANPQSQRTRNQVSPAATRSSGAYVAPTDQRRATLQRSIPMNEPNSAKDMADDVSVASQSCPRSQRMGRRLSHLQATDLRISPSPQAGRAQGVPTHDISDDASVGSQSSRRSQRLSERLSHLHTTDRRRSRSAHVARTFSPVKDPKTTTVEVVGPNTHEANKDAAKASEDLDPISVKEIKLGSANSKIGGDANDTPTRQESSPASVKISITVTSSQKDKTRDVSPMVSPRLSSPRAQRSSTSQAVLDAAERSRSPVPSSTRRTQPDREDDNCDESVVSVSSFRSTGGRNGLTRRKAFEKANNKKRLPASLSPAVSLELKKAEELRKRAQRMNSASPGNTRLSSHRAFAGKSRPGSPRGAADESAQAKMNAWYSRTNPRRQGENAHAQPNEPSATDHIADGEKSQPKIVSVGLSETGLGEENVGSKKAESVSSKGTDAFQQVLESERANLNNVQSAVNTWHTRTKEKPHIHGIANKAVEYPECIPKPSRLKDPIYTLDDQLSPRSASDSGESALLLDSVFSLESDDVFEDILNSEANAPVVPSDARVEDNLVDNSEGPLTSPEKPLKSSEKPLVSEKRLPENETVDPESYQSPKALASPEESVIVQIEPKEVSIAAPDSEGQFPEACQSPRSISSPERSLDAHNAYLAPLEKKKTSLVLSSKKTAEGFFSQLSLSGSESRVSETPSNASSSSVQRLLATAAVAKNRELNFEDETDASVALSRALSRKSASKSTSREQENDVSSRVSTESMGASSLYFSESDNESELSMMSKSNMLSPKDEGSALLPEPFPEDESVHCDDEESGQGELEELSDSQSIFNTDNEANTLIGQLHVDSKGSHTEHEGSTLLGQLSEDSKGSDDLLPKEPSEEEVKSTIFDDDDGAQKVSRAKSALNWWQKKYSRNLDENVKHIVEHSLTPMALDSQERENDQRHNPKEKQSGKSQMSNSKGASDHKSSSLYSDEESVFSGLDDLTRSESSSIASQKKPEMLPAVLSNELSAKSRGDIVITKCARSMESKSKAPPTPPPQEHCGELLDESQLVDTVNSDITSSVIATEGVNHVVGWSKKSTLVITEEKSDEITEEDETIPSKSLEEEVVKSPIAKAKSQLSRESSKKKSQKKRKKQSAKSARPEMASAVNKDEGLSRGSREEQPIEEEGDPIFGSTVFMRIGTAILDTFETVCRMPDISTTPRSRRARFDSNLDSSDAHSVAESAISQSTMNDREAKKWDEWDRRETESVFTPNTEEDDDSRLTGFTSDTRTAFSEGDTSGSVFGKQAAAHQKLVKYTQNALSTASSQEATDESKQPQSGAETSIFALPSEEEAESSCSDTSGENKAALVPNKRTEPRITVISTAATPMNRTKPPTHNALPSALSLNQSRILEKFCSSLKNQGIEILKQTRDSKWQVRYLTVSKELTDIKHVKLGNQDGVRCPSALLWLKKFNPKSKQYSTSLIDKHGKGGVFLSHLVKVTATGRSDPTNNLPKKFQEKYKESVTVIVEYNMGDGTVRSMALRCKTTDEAHFLCTGMRVCMDVLKREAGGN